MSPPSLEERAGYRAQAKAAPARSLCSIRAGKLLGLLDALDDAEAALAALRVEVGQAVAVARSVTHAHDGVPCSSGLAHLPRAGEGCGAGRCACGSCP